MKSPLFAFLVVTFVALILFWSGCATTEAYRGPDYSQPIVQVEEKTHWNSLDMRHQFWETHKVLRFENPLYKPVTFEVSCKNNFFRVEVPARTISRLLLVPEDGGTCDIKRVQ
jgi:hypothetical protein